MEVCRIGLRVIGVECIAVVIGGGRDQLRKAEIAFDHQAGLNPLIGSYFAIELDRLQIADTGVVVVIAIGLKILIVGTGSDGPIVIDQPTDRSSRSHPIGPVDIVCDGAGVGCAATQASQPGEAHSGINSRAQHIVDEARITRAETGQTNSHGVT